VLLQLVSTAWVSEALSKGASGQGEGLTEAQLSEELGGRELPTGYTKASKTISWWRQRQVSVRDDVRTSLPPIRVPIQTCTCIGFLSARKAGCV
jgi:hypothetical protein